MDNKAVFLDRDGVINRCAPDHEYICDWTEFRFLPGVFEAVRILNEIGYLVLVVTNQRGVARGLMTKEALEDIHEHMRLELMNNGAYIDGVYICPHESGTCKCRKPDIGLFECAERDFAINKEVSWMIGDSKSDILAGKRYGVKTILIGQQDCGQDASCKNLLEAVYVITGGTQ